MSAKKKSTRYWVLFKQSDASEWLMLGDETDGFATKAHAEARALEWLRDQDENGELLILHGQAVPIEISKHTEIRGVTIR